MSSNVSDILKQLDSLNQTTGIDIYIPSLTKKIKFKNLTLKQQKDLLKASVDETLTKLSFIINFYSIIRENLIDPSIDINTLYTFDRSAIAIALRSNGLDDTYKSEENILNLNDLLKSIPIITIDQQKLKTALTVQNLSVDLEAPHLNTDRDVSLAALSKLKNLQEKDVKTLVGELFIHEIVKFIRTVTFKTETDDKTISFSDLKIEDKISIIEKFPSTLTNKVLEFIKNYRELEAKFTTIGDTNIEVDGSFFSV
jgi:hypothetical protein